MDSKRVLITIKTYPTPSTKYREIVCTGGVLEDGSLIRLYPIDYRYRDYSQWFKKYHWIEVNLVKSSNDPRPESYKPIGEIKVVNEKPISTSNGWAERKRYVLAKGTQNMCWLQEQPQKEISLAIIRPGIVTDFTWKKTSTSWSRSQLNALNQTQLFDTNTSKSLEKIPYEFSYLFKCEAKGCKGHKKMIEDWEVMELYRKMRDDYLDENKALNKVREKFLDEICSPKRETYFFVGTVLTFGTWIVLGTFWPPKTQS